MGTKIWANNSMELSKCYARTFEEFRALESYMKNLDCNGERDISDAAYLLTYDDDISGEMIADEKQKIKDLWDAFKEAFEIKHAADIYIEYIGNDIEGPDAPEDGWYIGVSNYLIKNPALEDLDDKVNQLSWVTWG